MNTMSGANAYHKIGVESGVIGADPHKIISMLFQGALLSVATAKNAIANQDTPTKCTAISKAIAIVAEGLNGGLDHGLNHELVGQLAALYDYMLRRLVDANLKNDVAALDEVSGLLLTLKNAWDEIRPQVASASSVNPDVGSAKMPRYSGMVA